MLTTLAAGLLLAGLAASQGAAPTADSPYNNTGYGPTPVQLVVVPGPNSNPIAFNIYPLTSEAYTLLPQAPRTTQDRNGSLVLNTPGLAQTASTLDDSSIAYTSCDPDAYKGPISMQDQITRATSANASAIIFYSLQGMFCNITEASPYGNLQTLYTMGAVDNDKSDSQDLFNGFGPQTSSFQSGIFSNVAYRNYQEQPSGGSWGSFGGGSTAVAMIILYSITGIITALFLVIIVTGAIRAHRHPERYGPRNVIGRPRQSRAKGIARAMLETLPIVKFGEREQDKDVEAPAAGTSQSHELTERSADHDESPEQESTAVDVGKAEESQTESSQHASGIAAASVSTPAAPTTDEEAAASNENQGCSICTDDFERGQDIRVLPCNHQFHPACVDPWLLDVSGTCPLCRVDLNPNTSAEGEETGELPPPIDPQPTGQASAAGRRSTLRRLLSRHGGGATQNQQAAANESPEQRLAMLRRWREHRRGEEGAEASGDAEERSGRLRSLSRLMRRG